MPAPSRIARHRRARGTFLEAFGRSADDAIAEMDREGDDVPSQVPSTPILLQRIGIVREAIPVTLVDPFDPEGRVQLGCTVEAHTGLDRERRGIHVSRLGDVLARSSVEVFPSLQGYALALCERIHQAQACEVVEVRVRGVLSYLEDVGGIKEKESIEHLKLGAHASRTAERTRSSGSVGFNHITACPCVQQTLKHGLGAESRELLDELAARGIPLLTHSQRCHTVVTIGGGEPVPIAELLDSIDEVVVRSQNTLPRELELLAVRRAHANPQFLEDALRDLLRSVYRRIETSHATSTIAIDATSVESIHDFDISGSIRYSVAELGRIFPG
jgi:GTP cyclohydrolase IV